MADDADRSAQRRVYDTPYLLAHPASEIAPMSDELAAKVEASDFSPELIARVLGIRPDRDMIESWIDTGFPPPEYIEGWVETSERVMASTLVTRTATWSDNEMLTDLCANAPESVGDWSVTVERGPNPFAQYRLQERCNVIVLEDQRVALGMSASSVRNTYIEGQRTSAHLASGWRVRDGFRRMGLSQMLQSASGPGNNWFGLVSYWYARINNSSAGWLAGIHAEMGDRPEGFSIDMDTLTASIFLLPAASAEGKAARSPRVRPAKEADVERCLELINRTHAGLDLFRPYTADYLSERLDDPNWGPKPYFYAEVYGWPDFRVLEVDGEVVACGGLWDRGRDIREVWEQGDTRVVHDPAALLDFGFAEGHPDAMAELIRHLLCESVDFGRSGMYAAVEFLPEVRALLDDLHPVADTRELHVMPFTSPEVTIDLTVRRPYTDIAYW